MNYIFWILIILYMRFILSRIKKFVEEYYNEKLEIFLFLSATFFYLIKVAVMLGSKVLSGNLISGYNGYFHFTYEIFMKCAIELAVYSLLIPQYIVLLFSFYSIVRTQKR